MEVWIGRDGERHGPYQESDVRQWLRSGEVSPADLGWYDGMSDWKPLSSLYPQDLPDAAPAFTPPPVPPADHASSWATAAQPRAALMTYAGFWKRVGAYILDVLVLWIPNMIIGGLMGANEAYAVYMQASQAAASDPQLALHALQTYFDSIMPALMVETVLAWLYFAVLESSSWQGTVGKRALGIRVTDMDGKRLSFLRATARYFGKVISAFTFCIGFLMVAWTERKQGLHDLLAQTLVVNGRPEGQATVQQDKPQDSQGGGTFSA
ncbi:MULTISPECIES: RDD family protein [Dyella]|uniref:RDD family protein n=2 Tax=Dyella TaxID=231454 RepID=A0A4R0YDE2_9GAMM|nr:MULTISPECIES: RDD family protein [Dyella]TBR36027.1 RDD family protein [Dyella terrae]TCI06076.1 RDD family protein [Dyella soli]